MGFQDVLGRAFDLAGQGLGKVKGGLESVARGGWEEFSSNLPDFAGGGGGSNLPDLAGGGGGSGLPTLAGGGYGSGLPTLAGGSAGGSGLPSLAGGSANSMDTSGNYAAAQAAFNIHNPRPSSLPPVGGTGGTGGYAGGSSGGAYDQGPDKFEMYRAYIEKYAKLNNIDPDAFAAMLMIETDGGPGGATAVSHAGARGLGQIMPGTWLGLADPGDDPFNPEHSIKNAAKYFASHYKTYGDYALAAAAYLGGPGGVTNGRPTVGNSDGNVDSAGYAALFNQHLKDIKNSAPVYAGGGAGLNSIWGGGNANISQAYGVVTPGIDQGIYGYGKDYGLPQGHPGIDVALKRGSQLFMPAGMNGTVTIAGGTPYFRDEDYGDRGTPGKGELRITLDNGDIIIFGHTSQINVPKDGRVTGGQLIGLSGTANGDHLHLEVRVRQPNGSYRMVDPTVYFAQQNAAPSGTGPRY